MIRRSKVRFGILALISIGTVINYLDRAVLGVAAPALSKELGLNAAVMGIVFSAFSWTYAAAQIPGGVLLDRLGTRIVYFLSVFFWSACTLLQGFISGIYGLMACRLGLGTAEAPCFPANSRVLSTWFPQHERARANSVYAVGQYFGLAFMSPLLFWIVERFGWRTLFFLTGAIGLLFSLGWLKSYVEPHESRTVNQAELDYIEQGGGLGHRGPRTPFSWRNMGLLARKRQVLGAAIGQFAGNCTLVFFLTWFPSYLATERHMAWLKVGVFAVMPYIAASVGVLIGGWLSDNLIKRTGSANIGRKLPIISGLLLASGIIAANYVQSDVAVVAIMSVAFFGQGMVNLGWTLITDVAPKELIGLTGGIFNLCTNLAGIVTPIAIGFIVARTGSFVGALEFIAALAMIGVLSYIFIVGDVRRVEIDLSESTSNVAGRLEEPALRRSNL
jgi:ACS family D-galactonate transporter-like MFS transporter